MILSLNNGLHQQIKDLITWLSESERHNMEGIIIGFEKCVFFVDGNEIHGWRSGDPGLQEDAYDGYK